MIIKFPHATFHDPRALAVPAFVADAGALLVADAGAFAVADAGAYSLLTRVFHQSRPSHVADAGAPFVIDVGAKRNPAPSHLVSETYFVDSRGVWCVL